MLPPRPLYRGQGNQRYPTNRPEGPEQRGQTVPYDLNGAPAGGDADTLGGQDGAYYLARANHTGSQPSTTISDLPEAVQDLVGAMLQNGANISLTYDDPAGTLTIAVSGTLPTARMPAFTGDATSSAGSTALTLATVNANVGSFGGASKTITATVNGKGLITAFAETTIAITASQVTDFSEATDDRVAALVQNGTGITWSYNDAAGTLTPTVTITQYTDELAQDAIGAMVDSSLVYVDATPLLTRAALTGDCTAAQGSNATTVVKINGVSLAGLATGILKNTTGTGAPSIAVAADFPTLNQNTTGSAATLTTTRSIAMSGDVVWTVNFNGSGNVTAAGTIQAGAVTYAKMQNVSATSRVLGRITAGAGDPEELTAANLKTILALAQADISGLTTADTPTFAGVTAGSTAADGSTKILVRGTSKGIRFATTSTGCSIDGVDNTGVGSFQPLGLNGSQLQLQNAGTTLLTLDGTYGDFANDAAAAAGGVPVKGIYRNGSVLMVRVA